MKGINISISTVMVLIVGVILLVILSVILTESISGIELFGSETLDLFTPGENE